MNIYKKKKIIDFVREQGRLPTDQFGQIEMGKCYAVSSQFGIESARGGVRASSREAYSLTKKINEFYQQQCEERRSLWADISKLKLKSRTFSRCNYR